MAAAHELFSGSSSDRMCHDYRYVTKSSSVKLSLGNVCSFTLVPHNTGDRIVGIMAQFRCTLFMLHIDLHFVLAALYCFSYGIFMLPGDYATYLNMIKDMNLGPALISSAKFVLAFPLAYHTLNGMRHLVSCFCCYQILKVEEFENWG